MLVASIKTDLGNVHHCGVWWYLWRL